MAEVGYGKAIWTAGPRVWGEAFLEILVVAVVSLIPLLGAAVREVLPPDSKIYLSDAFGRAMLSGQLLFYALGLIATVVWNSNKDWRSFFPLRTVFNLYSLVCIVLCSIVIGYNPELNAINRSFIAPFSVVVFTSAILAYLLISVIAQVQVNVGKSLAQDDKTLGEAVAASRKVAP